MADKDLNSADFGVAQSQLQQKPATIQLVDDGDGNALPVTPVTRLTIIELNSLVLSTLVPPTSGYCELVLMFTGSATPGINSSGNFYAAYDVTVNVPFLVVYNPITAKWSGVAGAVQD